MPEHERRDSDEVILAAITTCKREPAMVERAIKSVAAQTITDWNLVVVDDSPNDYELRDDVRRMVEEWSERDSRIHYVAHDRNYGAQRARNTALDIAVSEGFEFIAYLDDDDEWLPEKLERQLAKFRESEEAALVYCNGLRYGAQIWQSKYYTQKLKEGNVYSELFKGDFIGTFTSPLIRTKCLADSGGCDEQMQAHQDYDTWITLAKHHRVSCVREILFIKHNDEQVKRISRNLTKYISARERIVMKNEQYLLEHKDVYRTFTCNFAFLCARAGDIRKSLNAIKKAFVLRPSQMLKTIKMLLKCLTVYVMPGAYYWQKGVKLKLKGEK